MATFQLKIVTPDGLCFDGVAQKVIVRTTAGEVGILSRHASYLAPLAIGKVRVFDEAGKVCEAACSGGMVSFANEVATLVAQTFEWADEIDVERAERALAKAKACIENKQADCDICMAEAKIKRALNRINVGKK